MGGITNESLRVELVRNENGDLAVSRPGRPTIDLAERPMTWVSAQLAPGARASARPTQTSARSRDDLTDQRVALLCQTRTSDGQWWLRVRVGWVLQTQLVGVPQNSPSVALCDPSHAAAVAT